MRPLRMVDLVSEYEALAPTLDPAMQQVLQSAAFINGPAVKAFAEGFAAYLGTAEAPQHVVPCANGTDALQLAMMALDLKPGDEVVVPDFTFVSTAEVPQVLGLKPILADVDPDTFCLTPETVLPRLTPKTRAIVPVNLFGQCAPLAELRELADAHGLFLIEDNAQATGARYRQPNGQWVMAGTLGHVGATSFYPSKNLGGYGDSGAVFTADADRAARLRALANHGMAASRYSYQHIGVNSRMDTLQATVLNAKLPGLDDANARRQHWAARYDEALAHLPQLTRPARAPYSTHVFHQYTVQVPAAKRDALREVLNARQVPHSVFYPFPLSQQPAYAHLGVAPGTNAVTERLCQSVLSLPIHPYLDDEQIAYVADALQAGLAA